MSTLSFKNLNKIYPNNVQAVFDFNLDIKDKEFIVFVGPSGCGKSTTLRMVAGLEDITSGELYIDGKLVNNVEPKDRDIAMVFQNYALYPHMTVYENMAFALKLRKIPMPLYEPNPEIDAIREKNKEVWKQIRAINRKFKKHQNDLDLLEPREKLYAQIYANFDEINKLRKPVIGKDEYQIAKLTKTINQLQADVTSFTNLMAGKYADDEEKKVILQNGIDQRNGQIAKLTKDLEYYQNNETPLTKLRHLTKEEIEIEVNKTAASIDLIRYIYRKPAALSGGQRQRVALGRAIVRKPKVFLMDEPLSNLDAKLRVQTRSEITKIHERVGATTIYVTHDQTEAMTMADRIVIMKDGYIQQIGTPVEVYSNPANMFVGGFIGSPSMNFLNVHYNKGVATILTKEAEGDDAGLLASKKQKAVEVEIKVPAEYTKVLKEYEDKDVVLGIRPEDVYLDGDKNNENPSEPMALECDFAELLGYELILYTYVNGQKIILKADAKNNVQTNDKIKVCLDLKAMHFFDKETGKHI